MQVSSPVYDRSKNPDLFLGVVGIDLTLDALDAALEVTNSSSNESFRRVVQRSTAICPRVALSTCELESYRRQSSVGDEGLCSDSCAEADFVQIEEEKCPAVSDYPRDLWINRDNEFVSYLDKVCCRVGETVPDSTCFAPLEDGQDNTGIIAGAAAGGGAIVILLIAVTTWRVKKKKKATPDTNPLVEETSGEDQDNTNTESQNSPSTPASVSTHRQGSDRHDEPIVVPNATPVNAHSLHYKDQCRLRTDEIVGEFPVVSPDSTPDPFGRRIEPDSTPVAHVRSAFAADQNPYSQSFW